MTAIAEEISQSKTTSPASGSRPGIKETYGEGDTYGNPGDNPYGIPTGRGGGYGGGFGGGYNNGGFPGFAG
jgi:hypothetical protein